MKETRRTAGHPDHTARPDSPRTEQQRGDRQALTAMIFTTAPRRTRRHLPPVSGRAGRRSTAAPPAEPVPGPDQTPPRDPPRTHNARRAGPGPDWSRVLAAAGPSSPAGGKDRRPGRPGCRSVSTDATWGQQRRSALQHATPPAAPRPERQPVNNDSAAPSSKTLIRPRTGSAIAATARPAAAPRPASMSPQVVPTYPTQGVTVQTQPRRYPRQAELDAQRVVQKRAR
jgi:hypothetical protein